MNGPFYEVDFEWAGFEWIDANDAGGSILTFIRRARNPEDYIVVVCNFTPVLRYGLPRRRAGGGILPGDSQ